MIIHKAEYVISAVKPDQYPPDSLPEIALVGRSNVGKSSLINKLLSRKALARTSSKPGKTRTLNFYMINEMFYFVDLPGYGYAKVSKDMKDQWGKMIESYLIRRPQLRGIIQLVDFRHPPGANDLVMWDWLTKQGLPVVHVATKVDKVSRNSWIKHQKIIRNDLMLDEPAQLILFSAETGQGKDEVWKIIQEWLA